MQNLILKARSKFCQNAKVKFGKIENKKVQSHGPAAETVVWSQRVDDFASPIRFLFVWWSIRRLCWCGKSFGKYNNHLNTKHLNTGQYGCLVFKWLSHFTWQTIGIPDILDHKRAFLSPVFWPPFKYRTIWQPHTNLLFEYETCGYCTLQPV